MTLDASAYSLRYLQRLISRASASFVVTPRPCERIVASVGRYGVSSRDLHALDPNERRAKGEEYPMAVEPALAGAEEAMY